MVDLSGVSPGWRGTDPDGGTWVRLRHPRDPNWLEVRHDGVHVWRSQEEAEAAGLVRLIPAVGYHYDERGEDVVPDAAAPAPLDPEGYVTVPGFGKWLPRGLKYLFEQVGVPEGGCAVMEAVDAVLDGRPPAPLDPGNPEDLREVDKFLGRFYASIGMASSSAGSVCKQLRSVADRLDRERAEAEQDASDRQLIEGSIREAIPAIGARTYEQAAEFEAVAEAVLRAERARKEAGQ